jgi:RNA polymerase sigma factor (sigma-70 family)
VNDTDSAGTNAFEEHQVFEEHRAHLRTVAYRMLGSLNEADDAVQEAWLRLSRSGTADVRDLRAWLTTVVSRVCLDILRSRAARREDSLEAQTHVPDPIVTRIDEDPAEQAALADSVGIALLVVLDRLSPAERLAFVLHDIFALPFEQIGAILDRSPAAAKQLASRARQRLRGTGAGPSTGPGPSTAGLPQQWAVVDAFLAAARDGDFEALLAILDPDVVLRGDAGLGPLGPSMVVQGAHEAVVHAQRYAALGRFARPVLVNGGPGLLIAPNGEPLVVMAVTVRDNRIVELDILADPARLALLDLPSWP